MSKAHVLLEPALFLQLKTYVDQMKANKHLTSISECVQEAVEDYLACTAPARLAAVKQSYSARTVKPKMRHVR